MGERYVPDPEELHSFLGLDQGRESPYICYVWRVPLPLAYLKLLSKQIAEEWIEGMLVLEMVDRFKVPLFSFTLPTVDLEMLIDAISAAERERSPDIRAWLKALADVDGQTRHEL